MAVPPLYLGCAVLFWAWHAQALLLGAAMAVALEAPRLVRTRWAFGRAEFARIADLCTWGFVILAGYLTFTKGMPLPVLQIFQWLPLVMLPLVAAQRFSAAGRLPLSSLFIMLRGAGNAPRDDSSVDLSYPYAVACVLSAGAANVRHDGYYCGLLLLLAWPLWHARSTHYRWYVWAPLLAGAAVLGYGGHLGLSRLQALVLESAASPGGARTDPYKSTTDIGEIGELKQSDRIVLRVSAPHSLAAPLLLHRASYNAYVSPSWLAHGVPFAALGAEPERSIWVLDDAADATIATDARSASSLVISQPADRGKSVLALPHGAARVEQLAVPGMQRNELGTVQVESRDGFLTYRVLYDGSAGPRDAPREADLRVPRQEAAALHAIAERLQLKGKPAREVLAIVRNYFSSDFTYSTYLSPRVTQATPLADFLLVTRAGHCEYFATATALLLRVAGLPARYATGYSVQEWSELEESYIARERHAHSWVRVRIDGSWIDFDTTPPVWFAAEAQNASRFQPLADLWSWAAYRYERWQKEEPAARTIVALALIAPLAAVLIWRLLLRQPLAAARARRSSARAGPIWPGSDSEFYQIERRIVRAGCERAPHEPLGAWLERVGSERADIAVAPLQDLLRLHYRYRFDPAGLSAAERRALGAHAQRWLQAHAACQTGRRAGMPD